MAPLVDKNLIIRIKELRFLNQVSLIFVSNVSFSHFILPLLSFNFDNSDTRELKVVETLQLKESKFVLG